MSSMERDTHTPAVEELWREHRPYLVDLAFRMLGRIQDAEDVVQEAFARLITTDVDEIDEIRGWLVVVVSRLCLDQLRSGKVRREAHAGSLDEPTPVAQLPTFPDPADRVTLDDNVRLALLVVLERLSPAERAVFVLHDVFQFSFDRVSEIVGRSPVACRQLASRARRRIASETDATRFQPNTDEHHRLAAEFIAACSSGDLDRLLGILDPDVVGDVDVGTAGPARRALRGRSTVGRGLLAFFGPRVSATLVSQPINGRPGVLAFVDHRLYAILTMEVKDGLVIDVHSIADPQKLQLVSDQFSLHA